MISGHSMKVDPLFNNCMCRLCDHRYPSTCGLSYKRTHTLTRTGSSTYTTEGPADMGEVPGYGYFFLTPSSSSLEQILLSFCLVSRENILKSLLFSPPRLVSRPGDDISKIRLHTAPPLPRRGGQRFKTPEPIKCSADNKLLRRMRC